VRWHVAGEAGRKYSVIIYCVVAEEKVVAKKDARNKSLVPFCLSPSSCQVFKNNHSILVNGYLVGKYSQFLKN